MHGLRYLSSGLAATLAASAPAPAAPLTTVAVPAYDAIPHASAYATRQAYAEAAGDRRFSLQRIAYQSDGFEVFAYVYGPRTPHSRLPVIIYNRGSYTWPNGFAGELLTMAHRLALRGFLVVAPMYRGSGGAAGRDEMGGADLDDLKNLPAALRQLPDADTSRLYLYGESRGGMMVYQALRDGFPARAAAVVGAFTDLDGMLANPRWAAAGAMIWPDLATHRQEIVARRSAIQWADKINTPVLIIQGAADHEVPPEQSLTMAGRLLKAKKPVQLILADGEDHVISGDPAKRDGWVLDWFQHH